MRRLSSFLRMLTLGLVSILLIGCITPHSSHTTSLPQKHVILSKLYAVTALSTGGKNLWNISSGEYPVIDLAEDGVAFIYSHGSADSEMTAVNLDDGHVVWKNHFDGEIGAVGLNNGALVVTETCCSSPNPQAILGISANNGKILWRQSARDITRVTMSAGIAIVDMETTGGNASCSTPFTTSSTFEALRVSDGKLLWQYQQPGITEKPIIQDGNVYLDASRVTCDPHDLTTSSVTALNINNGSRLWRIILQAMPFDIRVANGAVLVDAISYKQGSVASVLALRIPDGATLWSLDYLGNVSRLNVQESVGYFNYEMSSKPQTYFMVAINLSNGREIWRSQLKGGFYHSSTIQSDDFIQPPISDNGNLFDFTYTTTQSPGGPDDGEIVGCSMHDGHIIWQTALTQPVASPAFALILASDGDTLVIAYYGQASADIQSDDGVVEAFSGASGHRIWYQQFSETPIYMSIM